MSKSPEHSENKEPKPDNKVIDEDDKFHRVKSASELVQMENSGWAIEAN